MSHELPHLLPPHWREVTRGFIAEDVPTFDIGGYVVGDAPTEGILLAKGAASSGPLVLAGVPFFTFVFEELGCSVEWLVREGEVLSVPCRAAVVRGPARALLLGERTALNILARASGVASAARVLVDLARAAGWHGEVAGTRKVSPGAFRLVEKYALLVAGASTHRMDLSQMVMLKGARCSVWGGQRMCGDLGRGAPWRAALAAESGARESRFAHSLPLRAAPSSHPPITLPCPRRQSHLGLGWHHRGGARCEARWGL
jgi:nicotinate-nucleotide pyrophosphorylase